MLIPLNEFNTSLGKRSWNNFKKRQKGRQTYILIIYLPTWVSVCFNKSNQKKMGALLISMSMWTTKHSLPPTKKPQQNKNKQKNPPNKKTLPYPTNEQCLKIIFYAL